MESFIKDKGWKHLLFGLVLVYLLSLWSYSDYAHNTLLFPSSMMADLSRQPLFLQFVVYMIFVAIVGWIVEWAQGKFFGASAQLSDIFWTNAGGAIAFLIFHFL
jgi:hypothetical protein